MFLGKLDLAAAQPWKMPSIPMHTGTIVIPGGYAINYADHSDVPAWRMRVWVQPQSAVGQYLAKTQAAAEQLGRQVEEMVRNPDMQPIYLQLFAGTGTVALSPAMQQPQDGFYLVKNAAVNYSRTVSTFFILDLDVEYVSPGPPRTIGISMAGGALSSGFGGGSTNWTAYPLNATIALADATRTGAEGAVQISIAPSLNPTPYVSSGTIGDWWKGGCQVHDVMAAIGSNAVPLAGLFVNANWIEVFGKDHRFTGDIILTNGLILWSLALTASPGMVGYAWIGGQWQQFGTLTYNDVAGNAGTVRQVTLQRVSLEEVRADVWLSTSGNKWAKLTMRLQRGANATRLEFLPLSETNSATNALALTLPSAAKLTYNSQNIQDEVLAVTQLANTTDFGYAAHIILNSSFAFVAGLLWQDTTGNQPFITSTTVSGIGDSGGPSQNGTKAYGVFAFPFATPQNLQAEAEGGTLGTGWTSQANVSASAGNEAKCASGTAISNADTFGTAWVPPVGAYDVWFRVKVTSAAGSASEMKLGLYNSTDSTFVSSTTYKANQVTTGYAWYRVASAVVPTATKNMRFRAETAATLGTDWFIDEAAMVPINSTTTYSWSQDQAAQFLFDRTTRIRIS